MNKLINTNFDKCSKVDNCTDDRREFLILIDKNNKDDEERKNEIKDHSELIKKLIRTCDTKTNLTDHQRLKDYMSVLPTEEQLLALQMHIKDSINKFKKDSEQY